MERIKQKLHDLALALVFVVIAIGGFVYINPSGAKSVPGPGGMTWRSLPFIYSGLIMVLAILLASATICDIIRLSQRREPRDVFGRRPDQAPPTMITTVRRILVVTGFIAYAAGIRAFGFPVTTVILLFAMQFVFGRTDTVANALVATLGAIFLCILFEGFLLLPLTGELWDPISPLFPRLMSFTGF